MGRQPRLDHQGAIHFVTNRGTGQMLIVRSAEDRRSFLSLLSELEGRFGVAVIAFVVMGNHYHLIVRSLRGELSAAMQHLNGRYARTFNRRHDRAGALFQARFDTRLIQTDAHLERAGLYLHLNPVIAGLTANPAGFPWSSAPYYVAESTALPWLHFDLLNGRSGGEYHAILTAEAGNDGWDGTNLDLVLEASGSFHASDVVVAAALSVSIDRIYVLGSQKLNVARLIGIVRALEQTPHSAREVAVRYGLQSVSGVYGARRRLRALALRDSALAGLLDSIGIHLAEAA